jgi:hypothetical protein
MPELCLELPVRGSYVCREPRGLARGAIEIYKGLVAKEINRTSTVENRDLPFVCGYRIETIISGKTSTTNVPAYMVGKYVLRRTYGRICPY